MSSNSHPLFSLKKSIDKKLNSYQRDLMDKKFALQMREEKIENDLQAMVEKPKTKQYFRIALNTSFRDCSGCCGSNIIGCYSPVAGEHCERPLEIGKGIFYKRSTFSNYSEFSKPYLLLTLRNFHIIKIQNFQLGIN